MRWVRACGYTVCQCGVGESIGAGVSVGMDVRPQFFFVSRLLGVLRVGGGFQKKSKKKYTEHERVHIIVRLNT